MVQSKLFDDLILSFIRSAYTMILIESNENVKRKVSQIALLTNNRVVLAAAADDDDDGGGGKGRSGA